MKSPTPCLLVIDAQAGFHDSYWGPRNNPSAESKIAAAIHGWRSRGWPILHIQHHSTQPESPLHPSKSGVAFMDEATPVDGESVITKNVNSAFIGTDLESILRRRGLLDLVLVGFTSDHCVSTSARMASNLGFEVTVLSDATATFDRTGPNGITYAAEEVHGVSLASLSGEFARVVDLETYFS